MHLIFYPVSANGFKLGATKEAPHPLGASLK
jgi:hypothetical protein